MSINRIHFESSPFTFSKMFNGKYNGMDFTLEYCKTKTVEEDNDIEIEAEYQINITWIEDIHPDKKKIAEEGIKKLFKIKTEKDQIYYNF